MIVVIDVSQKQKECAYFLGGEKKEAAGSGALLSVVDQLLQENQAVVSDVEGIVVVLGQGRFTSTRTAVIIANSFASVQGTSVCTCSHDELQNESLLRQKLAENKTKNLFPTYYAPPNIT